MKFEVINVYDMINVARNWFWDKTGRYFLLTSVFKLLDAVDVVDAIFERQELIYLMSEHFECEKNLDYVIIILPG